MLCHFSRIFAIVYCCLGAASLGETSEVRLEHMTWVEVKGALHAGKTTVIIPTGGTEQNGPHMVLGKHNFIVAETARRIAEKLGNALVAPVVAYVPEGEIEKRQGHMAFPGTISVPEGVFAGVLRAAAQSFMVHGFQTIVFLGDSGGNQRAQNVLAERLTSEWKSWVGRSAAVFNASKYYTDNDGYAMLVREGETSETIGSHAGIRDTSELLAVYPGGVDQALAPSSNRDGSTGQPKRASETRGQALLDAKVAAAIREIREFQAR